MIQSAAPVVPVGFRSSKVHAGLILPESVSRDREVWTRDEWRLLDRVAKLLASRDLKLKIFCKTCGDDDPITMVRDGAGMTLRCSHRDRVFTKAF